jgi:hypothetical protein
MAEDMPNRLRNVVKLAVGIVLGLVLSVLPIAFFLLLSVALVIAACIRMFTRNWRCDAVTGLAACVVLTVCFFLPVKQLDVKVGPMAYPELSLSTLCDRLNADHGIICHVNGLSGHACRLSFSTKQPLSRREVLEKLSKETQRPLYIGYCGTSATILFGASPSFTYLGEQPTADKNRASQEDDIREAVFRWQFNHNASGQQWTASAYFLEVNQGDGEPSDEFMRRFADHKPPARKKSACRTSFREGVVDKKTGGKGLIFSVTSMIWISDTEVVVAGGYYEANLSASWNTYTLKKDKGKWKVTNDKLEGIS